MEQPNEINDINDKLVELYGKLIRIKYRLDTLEDQNVKAGTVNQSNPGQSTEQGKVPISKWPNQ